MKATNTFLPRYLFIIVLFFLFSCTKENSGPLDASMEILSLSLKKADGTAFKADELTVEIQDKNIKVTVPSGTSLNPLIPVFEIKGVSIKPASGVPQNFNSPVIYTVTAENGNSVQYTVTVVSGPSAVVYFGSNNNQFYAVDAGNGSLIWKFSGEGSFVYSSATYGNGTLYVGNGDGYVYAIDPVNGTLKWKNKIATTGIESDAVFDNGTIYVGTNDDELYALDASNGKTKWIYKTGGNISASPTLLNGIVYFGSSDGRLYALEAATGKEKWFYQTGAMINQSGPALVNGIIYVGSRDSYLYAINAVTGALVWRYFANGISLEQSSPTVVNGFVYIGGWYDMSFTSKGSLYALNAATGQLLWESLKNTGISSSPNLADGKIYITADDGKIHALEASTGTVIWQKEILANSASPLVSDGTVFVGGGGSRYFYAFNAITGAEKWRFSMPDGIMISSPLILKNSDTPQYSGDSGSLH
jgi:eukaryotic-like serine/threonine-protein kinase